MFIFFLTFLFFLVLFLKLSLKVVTTNHWPEFSRWRCCLAFKWDLAQCVLVTLSWICFSSFPDSLAELINSAKSSPYILHRTHTHTHSLSLSLFFRSRSAFFYSEMLLYEKSLHPAALYNNHDVIIRHSRKRETTSAVAPGTVVHVFFSIEAPTCLGSEGPQETASSRRTRRERRGST